MPCRVLPVRHTQCTEPAVTVWQVFWSRPTNTVSSTINSWIIRDIFRIYNLNILNSLFTCIQELNSPGNREGSAELRCAGTGCGLSARLAWLNRPVPHWYTHPESEARYFGFRDQLLNEQMKQIFETNLRVAARECLSPAATLTTGSFRLWEPKSTNTAHQQTHHEVAQRGLYS